MFNSSRSASQPDFFRRVHRYQVTGRNHHECLEIGYFDAVTPHEACALARRVRGHLCGGLRLEAHER